MPDFKYNDEARTLYRCRVKKASHPFFVWAENVVQAAEKAQKYVDECLDVESGYTLKSIEVFIDPDNRFVE